MNPSKPGTKGKKQLKMKGKTLAQPHTSKNSNQDSSSSSNSNSNNNNDKGSPSKDFQDYAGISSDSVCLYAEQSTYEHLSEEVRHMLTEDINYKLRYIIHESLIKAKLQGREVITSSDIDETFANLKIDKVYGAPTNPNWLPLGDNSTYHLDDQKIDLCEIAEAENSYAQEGDIILDRQWLPDGTDSDDDLTEYTEAFTEYFETMCEAVVSSNEDIRNTALLDISTNPSIGPITDWFYHFAYFLLMKDITYDRLTLRALQLLEVLENSPLPNLNIYNKQLKLLVRLLLQRLLRSYTTQDVLKPMCYVLSLLCLRTPLKKMVISKMQDKLTTLCERNIVPFLNIIYFLGVEVVQEIFIPNINYFIWRYKEEDEDPNLKEALLAIYGLICKANLMLDYLEEGYSDTFGSVLLPYWVPKKMKKEQTKEEINFFNMKRQLIKTRRKVDYRPLPRYKRQRTLEEVFEIPSYNCPVRRKLEHHRSLNLGGNLRKETRYTIGKTSLLLSVLKPEKPIDYCTDHSLLAFNL